MEDLLKDGQEYVMEYDLNKKQTFSQQPKGNIFEIFDQRSFDVTKVYWER